MQWLRVPGLPLSVVAQSSGARASALQGTPSPQRQTAVEPTLPVAADSSDPTTLEHGAEAEAESVTSLSSMTKSYLMTSQLVTAEVIMLASIQQSSGCHISTMWAVAGRGQLVWEGRGSTGRTFCPTLE